MKIIVGGLMDTLLRAMCGIWQHRFYPRRAEGRVVFWHCQRCGIERSDYRVPGDTLRSN
jgi:hypothetical protein